MKRYEVDRYVDIVRRHPQPSRSQMSNFASFLSNDHSWHKHLPETGQGEPFFVYLDPHAHQVLVSNRTGERNFRNIVEISPLPTSWFAERYAIDAQTGDADQDLEQIAEHLERIAKGRTTAERWEELGQWRYWNFGSADQPRQQAIEHALAELRVLDDDGSEVTVPEQALELGLVYLRAGIEETFSSSRQPGDRNRQLDELVRAMENVSEWIYQR